MLGKIILSQWLCVSAMLGMSSCNDDEVINQSPAAPLQVSVNTQVTMASRAIIHDEYLPDGHSIGISLTAEDGSDYDGKQFFNQIYGIRHRGCTDLVIRRAGLALHYCR